MLEDMQMTNKHMNRCSASLVIREMHIKSSRMTNVENLDNTRCWWGYRLSFEYWSSLILPWILTQNVLDQRTNLFYYSYNNNCIRSRYPVRWKKSPTQVNPHFIGKGWRNRLSCLYAEERGSYPLLFSQKEEGGMERILGSHSNFKIQIHLFGNQTKSSVSRVYTLCPVYTRVQS